MLWRTVVWLSLQFLYGPLAVHKWTLFGVHVMVYHGIQYIWPENSNKTLVIKSHQVFVVERKPNLFFAKNI